MDRAEQLIIIEDTAAQCSAVLHPVTELISGMN